MAIGGTIVAIGRCVRSVPVRIARVMVAAIFVDAVARDLFEPVTAAGIMVVAIRSRRLAVRVDIHRTRTVYTVTVFVRGIARNLIRARMRMKVVVVAVLLCQPPVGIAISRERICTRAITADRLAFGIRLRATIDRRVSWHCARIVLIRVRTKRDLVSVRSTGKRRQSTNNRVDFAHRETPLVETPATRPDAGLTDGS
jgi:hypothetical protein